MYILHHGPFQVTTKLPTLQTYQEFILKFWDSTEPRTQEQLQTDLKEINFTNQNILLCKKVIDGMMDLISSQLKLIEKRLLHKWANHLVTNIMVEQMLPHPNGLTQDHISSKQVTPKSNQMHIDIQFNSILFKFSNNSS